jgi:flavodoxin
VNQWIRIYGVNWNPKKVSIIGTYEIITDSVLQKKKSLKKNLRRRRKKRPNLLLQTGFKRHLVLRRLQG